jgi:acetate kinase
MDKLLVTINAGSSTLRFALFQAPDGGQPTPLLRGQFNRLGTGAPVETRVEGPAGLPTLALTGKRDHAEAMATLCAWLPGAAQGRPLLCAAHRVVHGGRGHAGPALVDAVLLTALEKLAPLAPLHQPNDLAAIRALHAALPDCPQVACFDTAFHRSLPVQARRFALPEAALPPGTERYGFHGLSYQHVAGEMAGLAPDARRVVALHLGNGASLCALRDGVSVDTTMGLTPLDGVPMGTRSGALDPGLLLALMDQGLDAARLRDLLYRESGLLGLSGISSDMRTLLESSDPRAAAAVEFFTWRCAQALAAMAVSLGGLDAVVFTGGIGEHAVTVRARILEHCAWLGISLDPEANAASTTRITAAGSTVSGFVVPAGEERVLATQALRLWLGQQAG